MFYQSYKTLEKRSTTILWVAFIAGLFSMVGCDDKSASPPTQQPSSKQSASETSAPKNSTTTEDVSTGSNTTVFYDSSNIESALSSLKNFHASVQLFLDEPNTKNLTNTKEHWFLAHNKFQALSIYLAMHKTNPGLFPGLKSFYRRIDSQPIQPGYLDYFSEYTQSGIVFDIALPLTTQDLRQQNGLTDDGEITLGFHAIEFLLWGEEGGRTEQDYIASTSVTEEQRSDGLSIIDLPNNRRRTLLKLQTQLLLDDVTAILQLWSNPNSTLRQTFSSLPSVNQIQLLKTSTANRLNEELILFHALQYSDAIKDNGEDNSEGYFHNQFARKNLWNIIQPLTKTQTLFFKGEPPFTELTLTSDDRETLNKRISALLKKLNAQSESNTVENALMEETDFLLMEIINVLSPEE